MAALVPVRDDEDFFRVREFLVALSAKTRAGYAWDVRRWDGARYYRSATEMAGSAAALAVFAVDGAAIRGALLSEGPGEAHLQVEPGHAGVEAVLLDWAEEHLSARDAGGRRTLAVYSGEDDFDRVELLARRGYEMTEGGEIHRRVALPLASREPLPPSLAVRATSEDDAEALATLLNEAFGRTIHNAAEYLAFRRNAPCFAGETDLVAVTADGELAAYAGVCIDSANRRAIVEPVCTSPRFARKGLAGALIGEGLRRAALAGCADAIVSTGTREGPNRLYESLGFGEPLLLRRWLRTWT